MSPENQDQDQPARNVTLPRILLDARLTRRKTYHILFGPDGAEVHRSLTPSEAIHAAVAHGFTTIILDDINPLGPLEMVLTIKRKGT